MSATTPPQRPRAVTHAVILAVVAFALAIINTARLVPLVSWGPTSVAALAFTIVASVGWMLVIRAVARGRNWARFVFSFLCVLSLPGVVLVAIQPFPSVAVGVNVVQAFLNVLAAVLLFTPRASAWFQTAARTAATT